MIDVSRRRLAKLPYSKQTAVFVGQLREIQMAGIKLRRVRNAPKRIITEARHWLDDRETVAAMIRDVYRADRRAIDEAWPLPVLNFLHEFGVAVFIHPAPDAYPETFYQAAATLLNRYDFTTGFLWEYPKLALIPVVKKRVRVELDIDANPRSTLRKNGIGLL